MHSAENPRSPAARLHTALVKPASRVPRVNGDRQELGCAPSFFLDSLRRGELNDSELVSSIGALASRVGIGVDLELSSFVPSYPPLQPGPE
jgi:hypothetical protein